MNTAAWERWRAAERAQGTGGGESGLSPRQDWILRALAALESADRSALEGLRAAAPSPELEAVAEIVLREPGSLDPTRFRAHQKQLGVPNAPFPCLDLLRLACAAHNREKPTRPQRLAGAARERPVLEAALMVLSPSFRAYKVESRLLSRSPRLASFWAAGIAQHLTNQGVRDYVRAHFTGVEPLPQEGWPDLDEPVRRTPAGSHQTSLAEFLRDPIGRPWSEACARQANVLASRTERAPRLHALGGLLDAIHVLVREGTPIAAIPAVQAALELTEASPEVRQRNVLFNQLHLLHLRLLWARHDLPEPLVEPLWRGLDSWPTAERAQAARRILEGAGGEALPRRIAAEVLGLALQGGADWEGEVLPWLLQHGESVDPRAFQAALREAPEHMRDLALGFLHALHHSAVEACRIAARLLERGAGEEATAVALSALAQQALGASGGRQERRLRHRAHLELARAAAAASPPPAAELLVGLLTAAIGSSDGQQQAELLAVVQPGIRGRLALAPEPGHRDLEPRLLLWRSIGLPDRAQEEFRAFGRWLRGGPITETLPAALRLCARLSADDEVVEALRKDEAGPSSPPAPGADPRPAWVRSLTAWVDRLDGETVARAAAELARGGSVPAAALRDWFEQVSELKGSAAWRELDRLVVEDDDDEGLLELLDGLERELP